MSSLVRSMLKGVLLFRKDIKMNENLERRKTFIE